MFSHYNRAHKCADGLKDTQGVHKDRTVTILHIMHCIVKTSANKNNYFSAITAMLKSYSKAKVWCWILVLV